MVDLPDDLLLEVKTSRSGRFQLTKRDLQGLGSTGSLCALLESRKLRGPRWSLVDVKLLSPGSYDQSELADLERVSTLSAELQEGWSNWLLDQKLIDLLLSQGMTGIRTQITWVRSQHPPALNLSKGVLREVRLGAGVRYLQRKIDNIVGQRGAQSEGLLHQHLLEDVLSSLGYEIVPNPVGVPDISARRTDLHPEYRAGLSGGNPGN